MSHLILGHQLRTQELSILLNDLYRNYKRCKKDAIASAGLLIQMRIVFNELKMMEYMADAEAMILLTKAGYTPYKAMEALNFLESISHIEYALEAHPATAKRIASANENISFANPDWPEEGKVNIFNSEVLPVKKSSDRVSMVINKSKNVKKFYEPENITQRLTRLAYISYTNGNMEKAAKYFDKLSNVTGDYIPYLYISYSMEYLYNQTKQKKYLKYSRKAIEKADRIQPGDINIQKQIEDLKIIKSSL